MKCFITIILDGVNNKTFWKLMNDGKLPFIEELSKNAIVFRECYTVFPSATVSGHASISTAKFPSTHGLVGQSWYHRERKEFIGYDFELTMPDNWVDASTNLNDEHLIAKTSFEIAKEKGLRTFSVDLVRKGADLKMSFIKPGLDKGITSVGNLSFLRRFARHRGAKKSSFVKKLIKKLFPLHVLQQEIAVRNTTKAIEAGCRFGVTWFMESDAASHLYGPDSLEGVQGKPYIYDSAEDAIRDADEEIEKLYKNVSKFCEPIIAILTDHGQSRVKRGRKYRVDLTEVFSEVNAFTNIDPHEYERRTGRRAELIYASSGPRMSHLYLLNDSLRQKVLDMAMDADSIEFVFFREEGDVKVAFKDEIMSINDFEFGEEYPEAKRRVMGLIRNGRCGDFVITAKKGYQFEKSDYNGAHGGLNYDDSTGFAIIHASSLKENIREKGMVTDVLPEIFRMMDNA
jgi:predicted AlkP superfamily pyrophosphatase or phosphodiesterase